MDELILNIKEALKQGLPGLVAQNKLAPEGRDLFKLDQNYMHAAVLLLLFPDEDENINISFIKRNIYNGHHSGQISFPGGKKESSDLTMEDTALRETQEEIGIDSNNIKLIGKLTQLHIPTSNFLVHPYIGITEQPPVFKLDPIEALYLIIYPIKDLLTIKVKHTQMSNQTHTFNVPYFDVNNEIIWGATAMILNEFIEILHRTFK